MSRRIATCRNCGLDKPHHGWGLCAACASRWLRAGCPTLIPAPRHGGGNIRHLDVDDLVVAHAVAGHQPPLNSAERRQAIATLRRRGLTGPAIAQRLGCATRTVERHLAALKTIATEGN